MKSCCPCDYPTYPHKPLIPAGLDAFPRQLTEFSDARLAMLRAIAQYPALAQWRAREGNDLGIMLLEMWAYILDILSFYDGRIADETYLRTAIRSASLYKLVRLIGYHPRPALGSFGVLAAIADGKQSVILPPRTAFRSDAFADEPPQIFETEIEQTIHPFLNQWTLAEVREALPNGNELLLEFDSATLGIDQLVLLRGDTLFHAGRVTKLETLNALDGNTYFTVNIAPSPILDPTVPLEKIEVLTPTLTAAPSLLKKQPIFGSSDIQLLPTREGRISSSQSPTFDLRDGEIQSPSQTIINLDTIYPQFAENEPVIIQRGNQLRLATIVKVEIQNLAVSQGEDSPTLPVTQIFITPELPVIWLANLSRLIVHFQMVKRGILTRIAKTRLNKADFEPLGIRIKGIVEPLPNDVSTAGELLLQDANDQGRLVSGGVSINDQGKGNVSIAQNTASFNPELRTPITVFGNLIRASRGESVIDEVLGSGNGSQFFQSFTLQNNPLTYLNDPSSPNGRRSTLAIRVNGILWREVLSFFGTKPQDQVYIVRQNEQQETTVTFGDGVTGARLPLGIDNVTATYRFGAGAVKPPAGAISQLANPVAGLRRAVNPVAAGGGADGDRPNDIRSNAPKSALILGRAVSVLDFEALAREFGGVVNASVEWAWDETCQRAVVKVWLIADGGNITQDLKTYLAKQADPTIPFVVTEASAQPSELIINVTLDPRLTPQTVVEQIRQTLTHHETGIFALANIPIGFPLFRSQIFAEVLAVEGTCAVSAITLNGNPVPTAITVSEGHYRDFLTHLVINSTSAVSGVFPNL